MSVPEISNDALLGLAEALDSRLIRRGPNNIPYLWRSYLGVKETDLIGGFLHRFVSSDELTEVHCHPWIWSESFILAGSYLEHRAKGMPVFSNDGLSAKVVLEPHLSVAYARGDRNFITSDIFHRVELLTPEVWTLFIHGPRTQGWGFVPIDRYGVELDIRVIPEKTFNRLEPEKMESSR